MVAKIQYKEYKEYILNVLHVSMIGFEETKRLTKQEQLLMALILFRIKTIGKFTNKKEENSFIKSIVHSKEFKNASICNTVRNSLTNKQWIKTIKNDASTTYLNVMPAIEKNFKDKISITLEYTK